MIAEKRKLFFSFFQHNPKPGSFLNGRSGHIYSRLYGADTHRSHSELITCSAGARHQMLLHTLQQQAMLLLMTNAYTCMHATVRACVHA